MVTRSNLDALSPGMMAKLDPLSRLVKEPVSTHWVSVTRNGSEPVPSQYKLKPIDRLRKRRELRTRAAGY